MAVPLGVYQMASRVLALLLSLTVGASLEAASGWPPKHFRTNEQMTQWWC